MNNVGLENIFNCLVGKYGQENVQWQRGDWPNNSYVSCYVDHDEETLEIRAHYDTDKIELTVFVFNKQKEQRTVDIEEAFANIEEFQQKIGHILREIDRSIKLSSKYHNCWT